MLMQMTLAIFSMKIRLAFPYTKGLRSLSFVIDLLNKVQLPYVFRLSFIRNLQISLFVLKFVQRGGTGIK